MEEDQTRPANTVFADLKTRPILVVDDDPNFLRIVHLSLQMRGYSVLAAGSAEAGADIAAQNQDIWLLITDVAMPGMSGAVLARKLQETHPKLHVLFISGFPLEAMAGMGLTTDARHFLQKPFQPAVLDGRIQAILAGALTPGGALHEQG
jgi:DNA-binding response OmpR family regulator